MAGELEKAMAVSAAGLRAQSLRMRVISENVANQDTMPSSPNETPYRRKVVSFQNQLDRELGVQTVRVDKVTFDNAQFGLKYEPGHPAADANGYVRTPNINGLLEMMDMRQAQRSYEANLNATSSAKEMIMRTIDLMR